MTTGSTVSIKQREAMTVAYLSQKGPYTQMGEAIGALFGGVAQWGLAPAGPPGGTYYNDPRQVPESELLWDLWVAVAGSPAEEPAVGAGVGIKKIAATQVAFAMHRGPYDQIGNAYAALGQWIAEHGYEPAGPSEEVYLSDPANTPPEQILTEVRLPVRKT